MHGLPLGVQIVGKRMEEEKVLAGMKVIEQALKESGTIFDAKLPFWIIIISVISLYLSLSHLHPLLLSVPINHRYRHSL